LWRLRLRHIYPQALRRRVGRRMDDKTQKRVQTVLAIVIAMVLSRPVNNFIDEQIPERRGAKDDLLEAVLQGAVRMTAFFAASLLVRKLAEMRR
jgi:hypothetical protein